MLILQRTVGGSLQIGDTVEVRVHRVKNDRVWLAISAPSDTGIWREEANVKRSPAEELPITRLLVVEDSSDHQKLISTVLRHRPNVDCTFASSGSEAMHTVLGSVDQPYDIVLLDLQLPDCSGLDVLVRIRTTADIEHTPVVVLSASDRDEDVKESLDAGATAYISKPQRYEDFKRTILHTIDFWGCTRPTPSVEPGTLVTTRKINLPKPGGAASQTA